MKSTHGRDIYGLQISSRFIAQSATCQLEIFGASATNFALSTLKQKS